MIVIIKSVYHNANIREKETPSFFAFNFQTGNTVSILDQQQKYKKKKANGKK